MKRYINPTVDTIFIMLGRKCNFNCRYCMQLSSDQKLDKLPTEINEDIYDLFRDIAKNQENPLTIHFYGGEPLVYFNKIKEIVKNTKDIKNIKYSIITNGSLINEEISNFLNENNFVVGVSWDGRQSIETRRKDVFLSNKENIFKIKNLGISAVLSHYAYPKQILDDIQEIDNLYRKDSNKHLSVNIDEIFDTDLTDRTLLDVDYKRVYREVKELTHLTLSKMTNKLNVKDQNEFDSKYYARTVLFEQYINYIKNAVKNTEESEICYCSNGYRVLNIDLEGNLYSCHNCDTKVGNIYCNYYQIIENVRKTDLTPYFLKTICKDCDVKILCRGGCKLVNEKARKQTYCKLKRAFFLPIIEEIINFSETIKQ